jgi:hypothetical protein
VTARLEAIRPGGRHMRNETLQRLRELRRLGGTILRAPRGPDTFCSLCLATRDLSFLLESSRLVANEALRRRVGERVAVA